jgi:acetyl/propionyl-CoA carboxylase alpha subunit
MQGYLIIAGEAHALSIHRAADGGYRLPDGRSIGLSDHQATSRLRVGDVSYDLQIATSGDRIWIHFGGRAHEIVWRDAVDHLAGETDAAEGGSIRAPMPGAVVKVLVQAGDAVCLGHAVMVIESMKLETTLRASRDGVVEAVRVAAGDTFERDAVLVEIGETSQ